MSQDRLYDQVGRYYIVYAKDGEENNAFLFHV